MMKIAALLGVLAMAPLATVAMDSGSGSDSGSDSGTVAPSSDSSGSDSGSGSVTVAPTAAPTTGFGGAAANAALTGNETSFIMSFSDPALIKAIKGLSATEFADFKKDFAKSALAGMGETVSLADVQTVLVWLVTTTDNVSTRELLSNDARRRRRATTTSLEVELVFKAGVDTSEAKLAYATAVGTGAGSFQITVNGIAYDLPTAVVGIISADSISAALKAYSSQPTSTPTADGETWPPSAAPTKAVLDSADGVMASAAIVCLGVVAGAAL